MFDWLFPSEEEWASLSEQEQKDRWFVASVSAILLGAGLALPICYHGNNMLARLTCNYGVAWSAAVKAEVKASCSSGVNFR